MKTIARKLLGSVALMFAVTACAGPPLKVTRRDAGVIVDFRTLGEYQTSVLKLRLTDTTNQSIIWELAQESGDPQLFEVALKRGPNLADAAEPEAGTYKIVVPKASGEFSLVEGREYLLEAWGRMGRRSEVRFRM
jgi:hypothetical protein